MNDWVAKRADERKRRQESKRIIERGGEDLWKNLCQSVLAATQQYAQLFPEEREPYESIRTRPVDGSSEIWIEVLGKQPGAVSLMQPISKRNVKVSLDRGKWTITGKYSDKRDGVELTIMAGSDETACFQLDGKTIDLERATEALLGPLLFPEMSPDK